MNHHELTQDALRIIGISPRLSGATEQGIPAEIRPLIPDLQNLGTGWGLIGTTGVGKSCAMAWFIKRIVGDSIQAFLTQRGITEYDHNETCDPMYPWDNGSCREISWIYWPDAALKLQDAARDGWPSSSPSRPRPWYHPDQMKRSKILILDDLGRERAKQDSFAVCQLESVIHHRYEHGGITLWNSNLAATELIEQYGSPIIDRLRSMAPISGWMALRSLR